MARKVLRSAVAGGLAAAAVALTVGFAVPAAATGGQPVAAGAVVAQGEESDGAPKFCAKLDAIAQRGQTLLTRLNADADTRGSIAWLNDRAAAATAAGNTDLAATLADRAARRTDLAQTLSTLGPELLAVAQAHCQ